MKYRKCIAALLLVVTSASLVFAASKANGTTGKSAALVSGTYTAKVRAFVCGGCGPLVQKTLMADPAIESASVDSDNKTATFTVKKGARAELPALQKALYASAQQMGMGADYGLYDVKKQSAKSAPAKPSSTTPPMSEHQGHGTDMHHH